MPSINKATKDRSSDIKETLAEIGDLVIDPLIFSFAVFILFEHIKKIIDTSTNFTTFWEHLGNDMNASPIYAVFVLVFLIWVWFKKRRKEQDKKRADDLIGKLDELIKEVKKLNQPKDGDE